MSCNNCINLGVVPATENAVILPLNATATGTWAWMSTFNGAYQYVQFLASAGLPIVVPVHLNEAYNYSFKLYKPDTTVLNDTAYCIETMPMLPDVLYEVPSASGGSLLSGKLQLIASSGQTSFTNAALLNAKQVVLFIEGMIVQEGADADEYALNINTGTLLFNTPLTEGQRITILYFK